MDTKFKLTLVENPHFLHLSYKLNDAPFVMPDYSLPAIDKWKSFELRSDDIFVTSFPKSGTTLVNEIVTAIVNDCDFEKIQSIPYKQRSYYFEFPEPGLEYISQIKDRRIIKTHLPITMLPENIAQLSKVIYAIRNPKDVMVSFFHFMKEVKIARYSGKFEDLLEEAMNNSLPHGPLETHVEEYLNTPGVIIVFYEDLIADQFNQIKRICEFLEKPMDDDRINKIIDWCTFNNMKSNQKIQDTFNGYTVQSNVFFRKGQIGDWINYFTKETSEKFDDFIKKNFNPNLRYNYGFTDEQIKHFYEKQSNKQSINDAVGGMQ